MVVHAAPDPQVTGRRIARALKPSLSGRDTRGTETQGDGMGDGETEGAETASRGDHPVIDGTVR